MKILVTGPTSKGVYVNKELNSIIHKLTQMNYTVLGSVPPKDQSELIALCKKADIVILDFFCMGSELQSISEIEEVIVSALDNEVYHFDKPILISLYHQSPLSTEATIQQLNLNGIVSYVFDYDNVDTLVSKLSTDFLKQDLAA